MKFIKLKNRKVGRQQMAICMLSIFIMTLFCGCSSETEPMTRTEIHNDLEITYTYNNAGSTVISKSVYNTNTGITTNYFYYYTEGYSEQLVGSSVVVVNRDGEIISQFNSNINNTK